VKRWVFTLLAAAALGSLAACSNNSNNGPGNSSGATNGDGSVVAAEQGELLSKADANGLEQALRATPGDISAREQLVGYYYIAQAIPQKPGPGVDPNADVKSRDEHLLWLIQNSPGLELLGTSPVGVIQPSPDAAGYASARDAWTRQLSGQASPQVKGNAGIFFAQTNDSRAIDLLTAAEAGDSRNSNWPSVLADLYAFQARSLPAGGQAAEQAATSAVSQLEKAWNLTGSSNTDPRLSQMAKLAVVAGQNAKAVQYATVLLNTFRAGNGQSPLVIGGPIHDGNMVLGQVALRRGDRAGAEQYLMKAGASPGSPTLDRYGPNFSLARDLLAAGSRDVVLKYCDEVAKFWGDPKLATWRAAIAAGKVPDFGDNLWN
jgi:hypothetical protein